MIDQLRYIIYRRNSFRIQEGKWLLKKICERDNEHKKGTVMKTVPIFLLGQCQIIFSGFFLFVK